MTTAGNALKPEPARSGSWTRRSGFSTPTARAASAWTPSSPSPGWPRPPSTSTSRARTISCWHTWTRSTNLWFGQLRAAARAAGGDPREQLVGMFDALVTACRREGYHGCAFINTAAEVDADTDVHARTVEHKTVVRAWVTDLAQRAGAPRPGAARPTAHAAHRRRTLKRRPRRRPIRSRGRQAGGPSTYRHSLHLTVQWHVTRSGHDTK